MKILKLLTLVMISLVLSMPIVTAATLSGFGYGQDGIKNFVRKNDQVTLQATVGGETVIPEKLKYIPSAGLPIEFQECTDDYCTLELSESEFESKSYDYKIRFTGNTGQKEDIITIVPDVLGPVIDDVSTSTFLTNLNSDITFTITYEDLACSTSSCEGKCSGIKVIKIYKETDTDEVGEIILNSEECSQTIERTFSVSDLNAEEGRNRFWFKAIDNFGNEGNLVNLEIDIDSTPPIVEEEIFYLTKNGVEIEFYKNPIQNVEFLFYVDEDARNVKADLSSLNSNLGIETLDCEGVLCSKTIELDLETVEDDNEITLEVNVELIDELNNLANYDLEAEIIIDKKGPEVQEIRSSSLYENDDVIGYGNDAKIYVQITDEGIGMNNGNVFVDFSQINSAYSSVKAESCSDDVCEFPSIPIINDGLKEIKVLRTTRDDLDNYVEEEYTQQIYSDKTLPTLNDVKVSFQDTEFEGRPSKGDTLYVVAYLTDASEIIAKGDFSEISDQGIIEGDCSNDAPSGSSGSSGDTLERFSRGFSDGSSSGSSGTTTDFESDSEGNLVSGNVYCEWEVEVTKSGTIIDKTATLMLEDIFGNEISEEIQIPLIYGLKDEENPNYWSSSATCSPSTLDREMGELIEQEIFCTVNLIPSTSANQQVTSMELTGCENPYVNEAVLGNEQTTTPYISLIFDQTEYEVNDIKIPCTLEIKSIVGTNLVTQTEEETVEINVGFFNNPYGMPDDNLIDEIDDIKETWAEGFGELIYWLSLIEKLATMICKGIQTLTAVTKVLDIDLGLIPDKTGGLVARGSVAEPVSQATDKTVDKLQYYCNFVNCKMGAAAGFGWETFGGGEIIGGFELKGFSKQFLGGKLVEAVGGDLDQYLNVKNNIYLSAATLCIPGIIHNLEKYRQIQCHYGYCLQDLSVDHGVPYAVCEEQKAYEECKYFVGPIFTLFPLANLLNELFDLVKQAISDPFAFIGVAANLYCGDFEQVTWNLCRVVHIINVATRVYEDVISIIDGVKALSHDYCQDLTDSPRSSSRSSSSSGSRGYV